METNMKTIDYSQPPYGFRMCANTQCAQAASCLRHLALEACDEETVTVINPKRTSAEGCAYYRQPAVVRMAKGMMKVIKSLPVSDSRAFCDALWAKFHKNPYYEMRNGKRLITPAQQAVIRRLLHSVSPAQTEPFDSYVDVLTWGED